MLHASLILMLWEEFGRNRLWQRGVLVAAMIIWAIGPILMVRNFTQDYPNTLMPVVAWLQENLRTDQRVGMWQSGTAAFLYPDQVVNLDGKVNREALRAASEQRMDEYVAEQRFDYIIDWDSYTLPTLESELLKHRYRRYQELEHGFFVWKRISAE